MAAIEHIRKPLQARQALRTSEAVIAASLAENTLVDTSLKNAMERLR
ncbi:phospholipase [Yersinia kristensenii]|nr:phospholipase [Yersinia kristensenii]